MTSRPTFLDSFLFLGMHSQDERLRIPSKNFFVANFSQTVVMSLEHVGKCDDIIWRHSRELQDVYYPFMDRLHTDMNIRRIPYDEGDLRRSLEDSQLEGIPLYERVLLAMALNRGAVICSGNRDLWARTDLPVRSVEGTSEMVFPGELEVLYQKSLQLRLDVSKHHNI